jgi:hypothetical protein
MSAWTVEHPPFATAPSTIRWTDQEIDLLQGDLGVAAI